MIMLFPSESRDMCEAYCNRVFRTNVTADSGIVTGIPVNVTGAIPAS